MLLLDGNFQSVYDIHTVETPTRKHIFIMWMGMLASTFRHLLLIFHLRHSQFSNFLPRRASSFPFTMIWGMNNGAKHSIYVTGINLYLYINLKINSHIHCIIDPFSQSYKLLPFICLTCVERWAITCRQWGASKTLMNIQTAFRIL